MARMKKLTPEQKSYFVDHHVGKTAKEFAEEINRVFGLTMTPLQVRNFRRNHGLKSGLTGRFEKGRVPHNKGKKFSNMPPNSGQFQKGHKPSGWLPVGTINYTTDGYPRVKVAEPNRWEYCHRQTWEKHHGPIPKGHSIVFLDGDKTNWNISNLACLSKNEVIRMNYNHLFTSNQELTKAGIGLTKLTNKIREVENNG